MYINVSISRDTFKNTRFSGSLTTQRDLQATGMPLPYYHNVLVFLREVYMFYFTQRTYRWRGWCATYGFDEQTKD